MHEKNNGPPLNNFKRKIHWSRHPEQLRKDAEILAMVKLPFKPVAGTFYRLQFGGETVK